MFDFYSPPTPSLPDLITAVDDDDASDSDSEIAHSYNTSKCLFCDSISPGMEENIKHMFTEHGFYVPDADACIEIDSLVEYLGQKINDGKMCIWCQASHFKDSAAVRKHMLDKGHCKMSRDCWEEYEEFYDFSLLSDDESDEEERTALDTGYELVMPSGARAGHRSLKHIYRQKLSERRSTSLAMVAKISDSYRLLGQNTRLVTREAAVQSIQRRAMIEQNKARQADAMKLGMKSNATKQKHFRDPTMTFG